MKDWKGARGVCVILFDPHTDRILMHKRCMGAKLYPGRWAFFGGGVEAREDPLDAIIREMWEETCYHLLDPLLLWENVHHKPGLSVLDSTFLDRFNGQRIVLREGEDHDWLSVPDALARNPPPHEVADLNRFLRDPVCHELISRWK